MGDETKPDAVSGDQTVQAEVVADPQEPGSSPRSGADRWSIPPAAPPRQPAVCRPWLADQPPVSWRELLAILLMVVLADLTIYRSHGFAGFAAFLAIAPVLLFAGGPRRTLSTWLWIAGVMLLLLAGRLVWCGSGLQVACGIFLLVAFSMAAAGIRPFMLELLICGSQTLVIGGYRGLISYRHTADRLSPIRGPNSWLNYTLPLAALIAFGTIFVVANPDLATWFSNTIESFMTAFREWIFEVTPQWQEVLFWIAVIWVTIGWLRPVVGPVFAKMAVAAEQPRDDSLETAAAPLYIPFRNTLLTVIVLFAVYLVFEFWTMWFREFPEGFYYAGYAHQGAAWLTFALALATVVLSAIFRGMVLRDERLPRLRRMAWFWSLENLLLATAVYNRMFIYIDFNGMTWMRTVGFFGITCVVAGFVLVVWKIIQNRSFAWLLRHHLTALALCIYLFALTPVDTLVHRYNVRRIMSGDSAPSVQISVHPISAEGVSVLLPLAECQDAVVREGVLAMLADRHSQARRQAQANEPKGWTTYQGADAYLLSTLDKHQSKWSQYKDLEKRRQALEAFHQYAYQWY